MTGWPALAWLACGLVAGALHAWGLWLSVADRGPRWSSVIRWAVAICFLYGAIRARMLLAPLGWAVGFVVVVIALALRRLPVDRARRDGSLGGGAR